jgi:hypothetical protein
MPHLAKLVVSAGWLAVAIAAGCAPRPAGPAARPRPPKPVAPSPTPVPRFQPWTVPTPARTLGVRSGDLREQTIGEGDMDADSEQPPPNLVMDNARDESLVPQIKAATAPNVAAALRMVEQGRVLIGQQRYDQALAQLQRSVSIDPSSFYGYYYLAKAHYLTKDYSQAVAFANRATALGAQADRIWVGRAYTLQAVIFEEVGRFPDARTAYQRAFDADPTSLAAYVGKSRLSPKAQPTPSPTYEDPWR